MKIKHVIWDWNGTLLDDCWLSVQAINVVLRRYNLPNITEKQYLEIFTFPVINYYKLLGFDFEKNPFTTVGTEFIVEYESRMFEPELHDGVLELMDFISSRGITQSLLSAAKQRMLEAVMDHHGIRSYFNKIIGQSDHYAYGKTAAGKAWMEELRYGPHEVLFIGDTIHDLEVAEEIGADCILVTNGHTNPQRLIETGAKVFKNICELFDWFRFVKVRNQPTI